MHPPLIPGIEAPVVLITGASAGIGAALARRLADRGARLVLTARRADRLVALGLPGDPLIVPADLRDEAALIGVFNAARARFGGVDVVINNAGLGHPASLVEGDSAEWREMFEVNVLALCVATREGVADMRARGDRGHIVHISSMAAHRVPPQSAFYAATKHAVRALTEGLRQELHALGSGIKVTAISPGYVQTEFAARFHKSEEAGAAVYARYPPLQAEDVVEAVLYALGTPAHAGVHDILMRPLAQPN